jgi:hypothetical protein
MAFLGLGLDRTDILSVLRGAKKTGPDGQDRGPIEYKVLLIFFFLKLIKLFDHTKKKVKNFF